MTTSSGKRNPVELLAEDFLDRKRRGERPTLQEYLDGHPDLADEIRDLFPALLMMEDLGESSGATTGPPTGEDGIAPGARLDRLGDYRILREVGRGGMGVVYEAEQESLGRRVALKVLSTGSLLDPKQVRRFEREAKAAARLHHTNIVPVFGMGQQDGHHYLVMQFIAGLGLDVVLDDLRRLRRAKSEAGPAEAPSPSPRPQPGGDTKGLTAAEVARSLIAGRFAAVSPPADGTATEPFDDPARAASPTDHPDDPAGYSSAVLPGSSGLSSSSDPDRQYYRSVARIGIQVAEALDYANRQGILHRDVKPSNLLMDNRGNVWVADFGLAKTSDADDLTHTGDILGTIRYMAPERFQGRCDARSDVYSLGLTLYELVALRPAFEASDRHALIERVLHEEPEPLKKLALAVPRDLETIITKASAREPATRYSTAAALAEDLKRFVEDRPILARRVSVAERLARWCQRNKVLAASLGVTATALVAAVVVSLLYADRQSRLAEAQTLYANEQNRHAGEQARAAANLKTALAHSNRRLALLNFERGRAACDQGQIGQGLLWMVESLRAATEADDLAMKNAALASLSAWRPECTSLKGVFSHDAAIRTVVWSPDGKTLLIGSEDKTARLWDVATCLPIGAPLQHLDAVQTVAFSPDGKTFLTGSQDGVVRRWEAATCHLVGEPLKHPAGVYQVAFSPDGKTLLTVSKDHTARLWRATDGAPLGQPMSHRRWVQTVAFSPDGKTVLTGSHDGTARLWRAADGAALGQPMSHQDWVDAVAFSPDSKTVLTGSHDGTARLWRAADGAPLGQPMSHRRWVQTVAFSPDGKTVLTGSHDGTARLWDAASGEPVGKPMEHQGPVSSAAFSRDSKTIIIGIANRSYITGIAEGSARLWDAATGLPLSPTLEPPGGVNETSFSPDSRRALIGSSDGKARVWDAVTSRPIGQPLDHVHSLVKSVAFSPDGKVIVTGNFDGKARLCDAATSLPLGKPLEHQAGITSVAFSVDGKTILTGSRDNTARLWRAADGTPIGQAINHQAGVESVAFSPDGKTLVTGSSDGMARLWDAATGQLVAKPLKHQGWVYGVAFSPDGKTVLTASADRTAQLWDAATGLPIGRPLQHQGEVMAVAFSPDGKTALTGSADRSAQLWDVATRRPIGPPLRHQGAVYAVTFSPDGKTILTGSVDKTARLWDAATGLAIGKPLQHWGEVQAVAFSPDGKTVMTGCYDGTARLWRTLAQLPDDLPRLAAWVETLTGLELDEQGAVRILDNAAWRRRRDRLCQLGGPPLAGTTLLGDPILFGSDPTARARAWMDRKRWAEAEAAFDEAVRARPLSATLRDERSRFYLARSQPQAALRNASEAVALVPDDLRSRYRQVLVLMTAGDVEGQRWAISELLERFQGTTDRHTANSVAWLCVLASGAVTHPLVPVRLAEIAVQRATADANSLNTLGAALYRASRFDDAIRRLKEGIQARSGASVPQDWAFLAMVHHRLGHRDEACRWLDRLRNHEPSAEPARFWDELEIRLLRSEAEAVVLYDPAFPVDPFAR
jgi:WD40 repeat protein/serine/threonine protein kinase